MSSTSRVLSLPGKSLRTLLRATVAVLASVGFVILSADLASNGGAAVAATGSYSIWAANTTPQSEADPDTASVELGVEFRSGVDGYVTAIRYYRHDENDGPHTGRLWTGDGRMLSEVTFSDETRSGWQQAPLSRAVRIAEGQTYIASYRASNGRYAADQSSLSPSNPKITRDLSALRGVYSYRGFPPWSTWRNSHYFVDVLFSPSPNDGGTSTVTTTTTSSTTSSPTTTTTATHTPGALPCAAKPSACGFPDATNTGVQPGVTLTRSDCVTARTAGQVIENLQIDGCTIGVEAPNVTIRNVKITHTSADMWAIIIREGASARIENVEVAGRDKATGSVQYAILSQTDSPVTVDRANLHHCVDGIQGEGMTVTNSYIHDLANPPGAHVDGFQCNGQCGVTMRHNTILNEWGQTSAIALFPDFGTPRNSVIDNNLLAGGGYTVYGGESAATGIKITNNRFARLYYPNAGQYGPLADFNRNGTGNTLSGNVWDDTGAALR